MVSDGWFTALPEYFPVLERTIFVEIPFYIGFYRLVKTFVVDFPQIHETGTKQQVTRDSFFLN
jgi:hypothetical protein